METIHGKITIELYYDIAPKHVERIKTLTRQGLYDGVAFHRVIDGFMAQTGDVKFGNFNSKDFNIRRAGMGGSDLPDLKEEFNNLPHERGTLSMARSSDPNSANSQFFICLEEASFLDRQYTVFGKVVSGMEFIDKIKKGNKNNNGSVKNPDRIISMKIVNDNVAKKEPAIKSKKKIKVTKVESKQDEFKSKETNQDNEAPVIEIAEAITVNDSSYEFQGKVTDKAKTIYVEVDGRSVVVKKGQFLVKGYSPVDKQISITAIDQWGNKSKPKLVNIIIDQKDTIVADMFEALDPSKIRSKSNKNRVALIIGIEKYDQTPDASFANLDAQYFYEYARKGFGISKSNIKLLVDEDANLIKSLGTLNKWLPGKIKSGQTELIIFFAGHGLASNDGKENYIYFRKIVIQIYLQELHFQELNYLKK